MKKTTLLVVSLMLLGNIKLVAQAWNNGGNTLSSNGSIGTKSSHSFLFKTSNLERGRITNGGNWGIGTISPGGKFHINSAAGQHALRVQVNKVTKFLVHSNGGVAMGVNAPPPVNGLLVSGNVGIGTITPAAKLEVINNLTDHTGKGIKGYGDSIGVYGKGGYLYGIGQRAGYGVMGDSEFIGVNGTGYVTGVQGYSQKNTGGYFYSDSGLGLFAYTKNGSFAAFFEGDTYSTGNYTGSDKNIKKNIQELDNALGIINQLKPKYYQFRDDGQYISLNLPKGGHFGLLAQDMEEVLPNLVKESSHELRNDKQINANIPTAEGQPAHAGNNEEKEIKESVNIKAINYTELIPLLIKGMQEQQQAIQEQKQVIQQLQQENNAVKELKERVSKLEAALDARGNGFKSNPNGELISVSLEQNQPNPVSQTTTFKYTIPTGSNAQLLIYEASSGKLVKTLQAPSTGQVQMNTSDLKPGTYVYSLMVDGKLAASKQMVLLGK